MDLSKCYTSPTGNIITPKGRMSHAQYTVEPQENDSGKMIYSCALLIPPSSDMSLLQKAMAKLALEKCGGDKAEAKRHVMKRFLDPMNKPGGGKPESEEFEGWTLLRMSSKYRPDFIGPDGHAISFDQIQQDSLVYSGRWARVSVNPYWFNAKANKGVTLGLQNIQLLEHDENIGGGKPKGEGEFEAVGEGDGTVADPFADDTDDDGSLF